MFHNDPFTSPDESSYFHKPMQEVMLMKGSVELANPPLSKWEKAELDNSLFASPPMPRFMSAILSNEGNDGNSGGFPPYSGAPRNQIRQGSNSLCVCGAAFLPNSKFCYLCGGKTTETVPQCNDNRLSLQNSNRQPSQDYAGAMSQANQGYDGNSGSRTRDLGANLSTSAWLDPCGTTTTEHVPLALDQLVAMHSTPVLKRAAGAPVEHAFAQGLSGSITENIQKDVTENGITTLMMCDIPCRQTIEHVVHAINQHGFADTYDLIYMPSQKGFRRHKQSQNIGYAFINFKSDSYANEFARRFKNYSFPNCASAKLSFVKPACCQGYKANFEMHSKNIGIAKLNNGLVTFDCKLNDGLLTFD